MTDLTNYAPGALSPSASAYISTNAAYINQVAATLGVSAAAIAGSIGREITASTNNSALQNDFETLGADRLSLYTATNSNQQIAADADAMPVPPTAGSNTGLLAVYKLLNPVTIDIGPGKIEVETAILALQNYYANNPTSSAYNETVTWNPTNSLCDTT